jgi:DNA-binding transcriptional LysR family regulator
VLLIAASGGTPYVLGALRAARAAGALTIGFANNPDAPVAGEAEIGVTLDTGPEAISGSTRLKAGTSQKIALNTFSSALMVRLNKVYGNLMVDLKATNAKLVRRAIRLTAFATGADDESARQVLEQCGFHVKVAIVAASLKGRTVETIRLVSTPTIAVSVLPQAMSDWRRAFADTRCELATHHTSEIVNTLRLGEADLGLSLQDPRHPGIVAEPIAQGVMTVIAPLGTLAGQGKRHTADRAPAGRRTDRLRRQRSAGRDGGGGLRGARHPAALPHRGADLPDRPFAGGGGRRHGGGRSVHRRVRPWTPAKPAMGAGNPHPALPADAGPRAAVARRRPTGPQHRRGRTCLAWLTVD